MNTMKNITAFQTGQMLEATTTAQGLKDGLVYIVQAVDERPTPFGTFVTYTVREVIGEVDDAEFGCTPAGYNGPQLVLAGPALQVVNGHLLLKAMI